MNIHNIRLYGRAIFSVICLCVLFIHHIFNCQPNWLSFISLSGFIVSVSFYISILSIIPETGILIKPSFPLKMIFVFWLALYPVILFVQQHLKYAAYNSEVWDLGIISHAFSSTLRGHFFQNIFAGTDLPISVFSQHTELIFLLIYPLFAIIPHPLTLVAIQSIAMSAGVYCFYRLASTVLHDDFSAIIMSICFSIYPAFYYCGILDIHGDVFAVPFIILMMRASLKKQNFLSIIFLIIALSCKEYSALTGFVWGIYCMFSLKEKREGILICAISCLWLSGSIFTQNILRPENVPSLFTVYYIQQSGVTVPEAPSWIFCILHKIFRSENIQNLFFLFVPVLFYCFRFPWIFLFLSLPLLKDAPVGLSIESHRLAPILPLIWYSVIMGLPKYPQTRGRTSAITALLVAAFLSSALFAEAPWSQRFLRNWHWRYGYSQRAIDLNAVVSAIPAEIPVSASATIYPHIVNRLYIYLFPALGRSVPADYVAIDKDRCSTNDLQIADSLLTTKEWTKKMENKYGLLLKRR